MAAGVFAQPECDVRRGAAAIASSGTDTITGAMANKVTELSYYFTNNGTTDLIISNPAPTITSVLNCSTALYGTPTSPLSAGLQTLFQMGVTPAAAGAFSFTLSFTNNDSNENPYTWTVTGNAAASTPSPELEVNIDGPNYWSADMDFLLGNTAFGVQVELSVTILNGGTTALTLSGNPTLNPYLNMSSAVFITTPSLSVAAGGLSTFKVGFTIAAAGSFGLQITINSNDLDENPFKFIVYGAGASVPEMTVTRGGNDVFSFGGDDYSTSTAGSISYFSYTITNNGIATLTLSAPVILTQTNCTVTISTSPASSLAPAGSTTMTVAVTPTAAGIYDFGVSITNNDSNENPYVIYPHGTGTAASTPTPGSSSGGGGGGGCSAADSGTLQLLAFGSLAGVALALRLRKSGRSSRS